MSDQSTQQEKALAKSETRAITNDDPVLEEARRFARRLKFMIVNGQKLTDQEVYALAHYSAANQLNPFAQECYYMPGVGPVTGIVGFRRKARESIQDEVKKWMDIGIKFDGPQNYWLEKRPATHDEAMFQDGDIAIHVTLHDSMARRQWQKDFFLAMRELREAGCTDFKECKKLAEEMVGNEPVWTGVGVVSQGEKFGADGKPEKYDRTERAEKRAEKQALKKRFPSLQQYDVKVDDQAIDVDAVDVSFSVEEEAERKQLSGSTPDDLIREMGCFEVDKKLDKPATDPVSSSGAAPENSTAGITLSEACKVKHPAADGDVYLSGMSIEKLKAYLDELLKIRDPEDTDLYYMNVCHILIKAKTETPDLVNSMIPGGVQPALI